MTLPRKKSRTKLLRLPAHARTINILWVKYMSMRVKQMHQDQWSAGGGGGSPNTEGLGILGCPKQVPTHHILQRTFATTTRAALDISAHDKATCMDACMMVLRMRIGAASGLVCR